MRGKRRPVVMVQTLAGVELFRGLEPGVRMQIEQRCAWRHWAAGDHIIDRESPSNEVYFIVSGRARVVEFSITGKREVVLDDVLPGGFLGELAAIDGEPRSATIVAAEDTLTASLHPNTFLDLVFEHRAVGMALLCRLTEMVRGATQRIVELSMRDAQNRVYAELLRQARTGGTLAPNTAIINPVPIHSVLAARVSTTRETVARVMSDLTHKNLVKKSEKGLLITDLNGLTGLLAEL
jgi:CRP/FNR family cyclic AMP-dependent transcriptional regulator